MPHWASQRSPSKPPSVPTSLSWWPTPGGSTCRPAPTPVAWTKLKTLWKGSYGHEHRRCHAHRRGNRTNARRGWSAEPRSSASWRCCISSSWSTNSTTITGRNGIRPLETDGLWGILFAPLLHANWQHLMANTVPSFGAGLPGDAGRAVPVRVGDRDHVDPRRLRHLADRQHGMHCGPKPITSVPPG